MSRCIFRRARPVSRFSLIRDLSQVFTLLRMEKLRSTPPVLTGKVKRIVRNELMNGNVWRSPATNPSSAVPGTASSGFMACVRTHFCRHKSTSPRSMNSSTGAGRYGLYVFMVLMVFSLSLIIRAGTKRASSLTMSRIPPLKRPFVCDLEVECTWNVCSILLGS